MSAPPQGGERPTFDRAFRAFLEVCELEPAARGAALARLCGGDSALRREVEELLAADERSGAFEEPPPGSEELAGAGRVVLPDRVGDYEVVRRLGSGAMGVVYEALQESPRRRVALKLLRPGLVTPERLRRFEHEAQVLGWLNHAGIAQIYESGVADTGAGPQPYLAMELVEGERLDRWAARSGAGVEERLELIAHVCDAVQHAHSKGVVHRDLKPANVLVAADGRPKILDFGVARITNSDLEAATQTLSGEILGTLAYMSPEQIRADPSEVDARSDVYALGVLAYELLAGKRPYEVDSFALHEAARVIVEDEPTTLGALDRGLGGDLEVLVAKAMAKEKERRYTTADELGTDIRRYLADEPIAAQRPSRGYRLRKFVRRNRALVAGAAAVFLALAAGAVVSTVLLFRVRTESLENARLSSRFEAEAETANRVLDFLEGTFGAAVPTGEELTARDLLGAGVERIRAEPDLAPLVRMRLLGVLGTAYEKVGYHAEAGPLLDEALALVEEEHGRRSLEYAELLERSAQVDRIQDRVGPAEEKAREVLATRRALLGPDAVLVAHALNNVANIAWSGGDVAEATELYAEAARILEAAGEDARTVRANRAMATFRLGRAAEGEAQLRALIAEADEQDVAWRLSLHHSLASCLREVGRPAEAAELARAAIEIGGERYGEGSSVIAGVRETLALSLADLGELEEAERLLVEDFERVRAEHGPNTGRTAAAEHDLAYVLHALGRFEEAERFYRGAIETWLEIGGEDHGEVLQARHNLALLLLDTGRPEEAEPLMREVYERRRAVYGDSGSATLVSMRLLATILARSGRPEEAEGLRRRHLELVREHFGEDSTRAQMSRRDLGAGLVDRGAYEEALAVLFDAWERVSLMPERGRLPVQLAEELAEAYAGLGDEESARRWRGEAERLRVERAAAD